MFLFFAEAPPHFIVLSASNAKLKETPQGKNTLFVNTTVLIALVKMSGFVFFLHFSFLPFLEFPVFLFKDVLIGFHK